MKERKQNIPAIAGIANSCQNKTIYEKRSSQHVTLIPDRFNIDDIFCKKKILRLNIPLFSLYAYTYAFTNIHARVWPAERTCTTKITTLSFTTEKGNCLGFNHTFYTL